MAECHGLVGDVEFGLVDVDVDQGCRWEVDRLSLSRDLGDATAGHALLHAQRSPRGTTSGCSASDTAAGSPKAVLFGVNLRM
jgi:hypothetical protein